MFYYQPDDYYKSQTPYCLQDGGIQVYEVSETAFRELTGYEDELLFVDGVCFLVQHALMFFGGTYALLHDGMHESLLDSLDEAANVASRAWRCAQRLNYGLEVEIWMITEDGVCPEVLRPTPKPEDETIDYTQVPVVVLIDRETHSTKTVTGFDSWDEMTDALTQGSESGYITSCLMIPKGFVDRGYSQIYVTLLGDVFAKVAR